MPRKTITQPAAARAETPLTEDELASIKEKYGQDFQRPDAEWPGWGESLELVYELVVEVERLQERMFYVDYCLDKWRHGAPEALAEYAERRMAEIDGEHLK